MQQATNFVSVFATTAAARRCLLFPHGETVPETAIRLPPSGSPFGSPQSDAALAAAPHIPHPKPQTQRLTFPTQAPLRKPLARSALLAANTANSAPRAFGSSLRVRPYSFGSRSSAPNLGPFRKPSARLHPVRLRKQQHRRSRYGSTARSSHSRYRRGGPKPASDETALAQGSQSENAPPKGRHCDSLRPKAVRHCPTSRQTGVEAIRHQRPRRNRSRRSQSRHNRCRLQPRPMRSRPMRSKPTQRRSTSIDVQTVHSTFLRTDFPNRYFPYPKYGAAMKMITCFISIYRKDTAHAKAPSMPTSNLETAAAQHLPR